MLGDLDVFLGRQPILDTQQRIVAYELLYRASTDSTAATFSDQNNASASVIVNAFASLGADHVLGNALGFFNVTDEVLMSDFVEALPPERVVIEVLENVVSSPEAVARCKSLRDAGFRLALDDYVVGDPRVEMLEFVDFVKVDLPGVAVEESPGLVRTLRASPVSLLAEKVETQTEFRRCLDLGFDLFQGYFFARPDVLSGKSLGSGELALLDLMGKLNQDVEVDALVEPFKRDATLGVSLMRLVNSAAMARPHPLESLIDAVNHLGRRSLQRWVAILLYAGNGGFSNPLFPTAAHRGRLMELVCSGPLKDGSADRAGRAFLVGMLSLVDVLLDRPLEDVLPGLNLHPEVCDGLLGRSGTLGALLDLVEAVERVDAAQVRHAASELGLDVEELQALDLNAYAWVHALGREG